MIDEFKIKGSYNDNVFLQISLPKTVDVSSAAYNAEKVNTNTGLVDSDAAIQPFIICHAEAVTLKVETWFGTTLVWNFTAGPYPMLLKKIYNDVANTATSIQIGY